MKKIVSILIPCFNEEKFIEPLLSEIIAANTLDYEKEIIFINDGSTDESLAKAEKFNSQIKILSLTKNSGKGFAIQSGLKTATGELILIQDSDLEYSPKNYPQLLKHFQQDDCDVVYGIRQRGMSCLLNPYFWGAQFINIVYNLSLKSSVKDIHVGHKVFRRKILEQIQLSQMGFTFCHELTYKVIASGFKLQQVPIKYSPRSILQGKKIRPKDGRDAILYLLGELRKK